jgi:predicted TIM-barrel fold metal-dependent hydrolase
MMSSTRSRVLVGVILGLAIYLITPGLLPNSLLGQILVKVLSHPFMLLAGLAAIALIVHFGRRRQFGRAGVLALLLGAGVAGYGIRKLRVWFPEHLVFSPSAYPKVGMLLLGRDILLDDFHPVPELKVENPVALRARYPAIDLHFHLASLGRGVTAARLIAAMDSVGVQSLVHLDGWPDTLQYFSREWAARYPGRFINFATLQLWDEKRPDFVEMQTAWLDKAVEIGVQGIKIWKDLGLVYRDSTGTLIPIDYPRYDFIWDLVGKLGLPVLMHSLDPAAFFKPVDPANERYRELREHPDWSYYGSAFPARDSVLAQRERLLAKHPRTVFIGAHLGMTPEDLKYTGYLMDSYPNYYVDIASVLSDLGRQPRTAREFFIRYQDRILFGTDGGYALDSRNWSIERFYRTHFQFLETDAEYFDYPMADITKQGAWKIYGLNLPDSVLAKVYAGNARKLIPSVAEVRARLLSLRGPPVAVADPPGMACAGRPYAWARADQTLPTPIGEDSAEVARASFAGDSVKVSNYSLRPGRPPEIVGNGMVRNESGSSIELRGYRIEFLSPAGQVVGAGSCRIRMGYQHCGLGDNIFRPGYVALSMDTLPPAPLGARVDTARVFWTYCAFR